MSDETRVLICMANNGQDPTECAIPWKRFTEAGFTVEFATESGAVPAADPLLVKGSLFKSVLVRLPSSSRPTNLRLAGSKAGVD